MMAIDRVRLWTCFAEVSGHCANVDHVDYAVVVDVKVRIVNWTRKPSHKPSRNVANVIHVDLSVRPTFRTSYVADQSHYNPTICEVVVGCVCFA